MGLIGKDFETFFASPERVSKDEAMIVADELREEFLLPWLDAIPISVVVLNKHRQILFCNKAFHTLSRKQQREDVVGLRPGEALNCIHSTVMKAGCGTSDFCTVCGAANAIIKSLEGVADCQECRLLRLVDDMEVPLDLQVFANPIEFKGEPFTLLFAMDISHELRLRYMNRTFLHGLINSAGGIAALAELMEADQGDSVLYPLLVDSSRRIVRDVVYHRDLTDAENSRLEVRFESLDARKYLTKLVEEECNIRNIQASFVHMNIQCETILSDKRLLGHVVRNLLVNALEAGESKMGQIVLNCWSSEDGSTSISVENQGEIPLDIKRQMFKRYVSTKSKDRGLGTYIVKLFTEKYLNGSASFQSNEGKTIFTVTIP